MPVQATIAAEDAPAMKIENEQQEENEMIKEINEEDTLPITAVGDVLVNEPLNEADDGEEEKRDVVKMNSDDSVLSTHGGIRG